MKLPETKLGKLIAESFRLEPPFRNWFFRRVAEKIPAWSAKELHIMFVRDDWPEARLDSRRTDIWASCSEHEGRSSCTHLLLVELKITAPFDVGQAEDYKKRACKAFDHQMCTVAATVLIAPERYLVSHAGDAGHFNVTMTLEDIKKFFDNPPDGFDDVNEDRYVGYRSAIGRALADAAEGYMPLGDKLREQQFRWYQLFVEEYKPHLQVRRKKGSRQAYDISLEMPFEQFGYIKHRLFEFQHPGRVVIELTGWAKRLMEVQDFLQKLDGGRAIAELPPKADSPSNLYIRLKDSHVKPLSKIRGFAEQEAEVRGAVDAVDDLWQWAKRNHEVIMQIAKGGGGRGTR